MDGTAHLVTASDVDSHSNFASRFDRYGEEYKELDDEKYRDRAVTLARDAIIDFVERLMVELTSDGRCEDMAKISLFEVNKWGGGGIMPLFRGPRGGGRKRRRRARMIAGGGTFWWSSSRRPNGVMDKLVRVVSLDGVFSSSFPSSPLFSIPPRRTGIFMPDNDPFVYASRDHLIVPARGRVTEEENDGDEGSGSSWTESTMLRILRLRSDGEAAEPIGIAVVLGHIQNKYSMDEYRGQLRVASTLPRRWGCRDEILGSGGQGGSALASWYPGCNWGVVRESTSQVTILKIPERGAVTDPVIEEMGVVDNLGTTEEIYGETYFGQIQKKVVTMLSGSFAYIKYMSRCPPCSFVYLPRESSSCTFHGP